MQCIASFLVDKEMRNAAKAEEICEFVSKALETFPSDADSAIQAVRVLELLSLKQDNREILISAGVCENLASMLFSFPFHVQLVKPGIGTIINLLRKKDEIKERLGAAGALELMVSCLRNFPEHADIQLCSLQVLGTLLYNHTGNNTRIDSKRGSEAVVEAMECYPLDSDIQLAGCKCIGNLTKGNEENASALEDKACEVLVRAIVFPGDKSLEFQALRAVCNALQACPELSDKLGECGICYGVVQAAGAFPDHEKLQDHGIMIMLELTYDGGPNIRRLGSAGACRCVVEVSRRFNSREITLNCLKAFFNLSYGDVENNKELGEAGAPERICAALSNFKDDADIVYHGICAIKNMSVDADNNREMGLAGVPEALVEAMLRFLSNREIINYGLKAIINLAWVAENQEALGQADACKAIGSIIAQHEEDVDVMQNALSAALRLSLDHPENQKRLGLEGFCDQVLAGFTKFGNDKEVQLVYWYVCMYLCA